MMLIILQNYHDVLHIQVEILRSKISETMLPSPSLCTFTKNHALATKIRLEKYQSFDQTAIRKSYAWSLLLIHAYGSQDKSNGSHARSIVVPNTSSFKQRVSR